MEKVQFTATFPSIAAGDLAEFKRQAEVAIAKVAENEPGALQYDWFLNDDETVCVVREAYADSAAILAHMANVGDLIAPMVEMGGGLELEVFGSVSPEVDEALDALSPATYTFFAGR